ncbi:MAG: DUF2807 domain-containing protein [Paludibacter sp.]|nr:DUF2807 domain-containing protein [Paludibacter sp.]
MKKVVLFLMIIGLMPTMAFGQKAETRQVSGFTGIKASSMFDITVTKGDVESLVIEAEENVMQYVRSEVRKGVLHLYLDNKNNLNNIKLLKASIVMKNLENVTLSGACKLTAKDLFSPAKFKSECSGATELTVNLNTNQLDVEVNGACKMEITANVTGKTDLDLSGAAKITGTLKTNALKISNSGVGTVTLTGSATNVDMKLSGTSKVNAKNFVIQNANISSSGMSAATVNVSTDLKVDVSGMASVKYKGNAAVKADTSGMGKVKKI